MGVEEEGEGGFQLRKVDTMTLAYRPAHGSYEAMSSVIASLFFHARVLVKLTGRAQSNR